MQSDIDRYRTYSTELLHKLIQDNIQMINTSGFILGGIPPQYRDKAIERCLQHMDLIRAEIARRGE